jgi:hypothetical protein
MPRLLRFDRVSCFHVYGGPQPLRTGPRLTQGDHKTAADVADGVVPHIQPDREAETLSAGFITTAIILVVGYVILSKVIGFAFRLVIPVVLILVLGGAGALSGLFPQRYPDNQSVPYTRAQEHPGDIGDLRLRDLADMAVGAARSVLQGMLALLDGTAGYGAEPEPRWVDQRQPRHGGVYEAPSDFDDVPHHGGGRRGW